MFCFFSRAILIIAIYTYIHIACARIITELDIYVRDPLNGSKVFSHLSRGRLIFPAALQHWWDHPLSSEGGKRNLNYKYGDDNGINVIRSKARLIWKFANAARGCAGLFRCKLTCHFVNRLCLRNIINYSQSVTFVSKFRCIPNGSFCARAIGSDFTWKQIFVLRDIRVKGKEGSLSFSTRHDCLSLYITTL